MSTSDCTDELISFIMVSVSFPEQLRGHENPKSLLLDLSILSKFHAHLFCSFCVILLTIQQTDTGTNISSLTD